MNIKVIIYTFHPECTAKTEGVTMCPTKTPTESDTTMSATKALEVMSGLLQSSGADDEAYVALAALTRQIAKSQDITIWSEHELTLALIGICFKDGKTTAAETIHKMRSTHSESRPGKGRVEIAGHSVDVAITITKIRGTG